MVEIVTAFHAASIHIRDVQKARMFYRDVLGFRELRFDEKTGRLAFALPNSSTLLTMHVQGPGEGGREPGTVSGLIFRSPDPAAACAEIKRRGGSVTVEPNTVETPSGSFVRAVIADPDGNEFVISNRPD